MKANELRIGNWVNDVKGGGYNVPGFQRVRKIDEKGVNHWQDMGASGYAKFEDIEPIPLTPEILVKAGFKRWHDGTHRKQIDEYIVFHVEEDGCYGFWSDSKENEADFTLRSQDNHIEYLHQLQNLFFALTGQELEIEL